MRKHIILSYVHESKEFEYDFDLTNLDHQGRIISTLSWAARKGVEIYIVPKILAAEVEPKQINPAL